MNGILFKAFYLFVFSFVHIGHASEQAADRGHTMELGVAEFRDRSPSGQYYCEIDGKADATGERVPGWNIYLIAKAHPGKKTLIFDTIRTADIKWSSFDKWFAILDYADGHTTNIYIYIIIDDGEKLIAKTIYQSPTVGIANSHILTDDPINTYFWDIVSWDILNGEVKIQCKFRSDLSNDFKTRTYIVPVCFPH